MALTREQRDRYNAQAREKAALAAVAAGRVPGKQGQPPKGRSEEELREMRRVKSAKWRVENLEKTREINRRSMKKAAAEKAIADGRTPGKIGPQKIFSDEEKRAKRLAKAKKYYYANIEKCREEARVREQAKRDGTFVSRALPRLTAEERRLTDVAMSANRRLRIRANGGRAAGAKVTKEQIAQLYLAQGGVCPVCAEYLGPENPHLDHWIPIVAGGTNDFDNLRLLHPKCNLVKGAMLPSQIISAVSTA